MAYATEGTVLRRPGLARRRLAIRAAEGIVGGVVVLLLFQLALGFSLTDSEFWNAFQVFFLPGVRGTLSYVALIIPVSVALGFLTAWARTSKYRVLSWPATLYVEFFRGVPPLVIVVFASLFGADFIPARFYTRTVGFIIAAFALALHSGAYQAEIFRAGFQSVPRGQLEASQALGMRPLQAMRHVVLPQALRVSLPPLGNELAVVIKDTSLLSAIGVLDMFGAGQDFTPIALFDFGRIDWLFAMWSSIAILYFFMTFVTTRLLLFLERRLRVPGLEGVSI